MILFRVKTLGELGIGDLVIAIAVNDQEAFVVSKLRQELSFSSVFKRLPKVSSSQIFRALRVDLPASFHFTVRMGYLVTWLPSWLAVLFISSVSK